MKCFECGREVAITVNYCYYCGTPNKKEVRQILASCLIGGFLVKSESGSHVVFISDDELESYVVRITGTDRFLDTISEFNQWLESYIYRVMGLRLQREESGFSFHRNDKEVMTPKPGSELTQPPKRKGRGAPYRADSLTSTARRLSLPDYKVVQLIDEGTLQASTTGDGAAKRWHVDQDSVDRYLETLG
jgi:hypothetical protein